MSSASTPEGQGSVSGAQNLPAGFADTFSSRYIDTGQARLHAVIGGGGPPLLLVHGWPQKWYAWRMLMPRWPATFRSLRLISAALGCLTNRRRGTTALPSPTIWSG